MQGSKIKLAGLVAPGHPIAPVLVLSHVYAKLQQEHMSEHRPVKVTCYPYFNNDGILSDPANILYERPLARHWSDQRNLLLRCARPSSYEIPE